MRVNSSETPLYSVLTKPSTAIVIYWVLFQDIERHLDADVDEVQEFLQVLMKPRPQTLSEIEQLADQYLDDELIDPG